MRRYEHYQTDLTFPSTTTRWHLYGAGLESLGKSGLPESVPIPEPNPNQLLVRMDAVGICYSDVKITRLGPQHPRLTGRDMIHHPVIMGHEVACTAVKIGQNLTQRFKPGQRFVAQADVFYGGKSMAMGYVLEGGFTQYGIIPEPMIEGDEGCYLIPNAPDLTYVEGALVEPWACVVASYQIAPRRAPKVGGVWVVIAHADSHVEYQFSALLDANTTAEDGGTIIVSGATGKLRQHLQFAAQSHGLRWVELPENWAFDEGRSSETWQSLSQTHTHGEGFDDVILMGNLPDETTQHGLDSLGRGGHFLFSRHRAMPPLDVDMGRVHYDNVVIAGTTGWDISEAYHHTRNSQLIPGGALMILGAGGPMGQMQIHYALSQPQPPRLIVAVDRHAERIESLKAQFEDLAQNRNIALTFFNSAGLRLDEQSESLRTLSGGFGYDDIMCLSSAPDAIQMAYPLLTSEGLLNLFAGVPRGTRLPIDLTPFATRHVRILGSSGSSLADMKRCLELTETGELPTRRVLAAIGGMNSVHQGIDAMAKHLYPGKIVIFPHLPDLPLLGLQELQDRLPSVYQYLEDGRFWTRQAEQELFEQFLK